WLFAVGACSGAFYPLGLSVLGERIPPAGLARANAWFLAINCVGSMTGPVMAGRMMDWFGERAMFLAGAAAVVLVLLTSGFLKWRSRATEVKLPDELARDKDRITPSAA